MKHHERWIQKRGVDKVVTCDADRNALVSDGGGWGGGGGGNKSNERIP